MKITKQRLKQIIREELQAEAEDDALRGSRRLGRDIEDIADEPAEDDTRDRAFTSPEERLLILIKAREALRNMTDDELEDLSMSLDADMVASLRHILANPMYAPMGGQGDEMELEEYRGGADAAQSRKRMDNYRGGPEAEQSQQRMQNYRGGATRSANPGPRQADDPSKSPYGRSR